jgi:alpha-galactosidase
MIGDWEVSKAKFPDFRGHVEKVRSMGLKYLLWVSPALIGVKSKILRELGPGAVSEKPFEGARTLNPADKHAATLITEKLAGLVGRLGLDGLKIDFLDYFKPDMSRPSGRAALALVSELSEKIRQSVPDALIEFRQSYATPGMTPHATQFRAGDVPFDFLDNFNRLCQIRVSMGDGVPVHSDPVFWRPDESLVNVSRHMIASLAGVPMLSMDPALMSADSKAVVKHWMDFYRAHKKTLAFGRWQISYNLSNVSFAAAVTAEESVIILNDARALDEALSLVSGDAHILNLSGAELSVNDAEIFSVTGEKGSANQLARGGRALTRR